MAKKTMAKKTARSNAGTAATARPPGKGLSSAKAARGPLNRSRQIIDTCWAIVGDTLEGKIDPRAANTACTAISRIQRQLALELAVSRGGSKALKLLK